MIKKALVTSLLALSAAFSYAAVDINSASEADLDSIKGIGPSTSSKILDARKTAKFKDWGDLIKRVKGISEKRAATLSNEGLTVNGEAFQASVAKTGSGEKSAKAKSPSMTEGKPSTMSTTSKQ